MHERRAVDLLFRLGEVAPVSRRVGYLAPMGSDWMVDEAGWDASWAW